MESEQNTMKYMSDMQLSERTAQEEGLHSCDCEACKDRR